MDERQFREELESVELTLAQTLDSAVLDSGINSKGALVGKILSEKYRVDSILGSGGAGIVYKGHDILLDRPIAIKTLTAAKEIDAKALMRFQREGQAAIDLKHPNIAGVETLGIHDGIAYLIMEYVDGTPLSKVLEQGPLEPNRALHLLNQLLMGLAIAHKVGIAHRDIKPQNLLLKILPDGSEQLKLVDFGIAKIVEQQDARNLTQTGEIFGTPNYMSPEQCTGKPTDQRSDIYSVGCVAYEMVTGKPPFIGDSTLEVLMKHVNERAPEVTNAPIGLNDVIERAMEKEPSRRYKSAEAMLKDVELVLSGQRPKTKSKPRFGRRQLMLLGLGSTMAIIVFGLVMTFLIAPFASSKFFESGDKQKAMGNYVDASNCYLAAWLCSFLKNDEATFKQLACQTLLASADRENGNDNECIKSFHTLNFIAKRAIASRPNDYRSHLYRAIATANLGYSDEEILSDFTEAIRLNPNNDLNNLTVTYVDLAKYLNSMAMLPGRTKDYQKAKENADKAIRLDNRFSEAFSARATANLGLKNVDEALKDANKALELDPNSLAARLAHAEAVQQQSWRALHLSLPQYRVDCEYLSRSKDSYYVHQALDFKADLARLKNNWVEYNDKSLQAKRIRLSSSTRVTILPPFVNPFEK